MKYVSLLLIESLLEGCKVKDLDGAFLILIPQDKIKACDVSSADVQILLDNNTLIGINTLKQFYVKVNDEMYVYHKKLVDYHLSLLKHTIGFTCYTV